MKSIRYYVANCLECNKKVLIEMKFLEFEKDCCVDFNNLKILKMFNDEGEARNYIKLFENEEE